MSFSFTKTVPPQFAHWAPTARASVASVYQESAPDLANTSTTLRFTVGSFSGLLHPVHANTAIGTPQTRCREMHQSGRVSTMFEMRSSPQAGSHLTFLISSIPRDRKVISSSDAPSKLRWGQDFVSIEMNHRSVARKMTGCRQPQQ